MNISARSFRVVHANLITLLLSLKSKLTGPWPLLMDRLETREDEYVIDIERSSDASSLGSQHDLHNEDRPSNGPRVPITHPPSSSSPNSNPRRLVRRTEGLGQRQSRRFSNVFIWIFIELLFTLGKIIAAIVVLSRSANENPDTPLYAWIVWYASACAATLPLMYWRYQHRIVYAGTWTGLSVGGPNLWLNMLVDYFKMTLDFFFAIWFVVGNFWIFAGHSLSAKAPNMYRLCIVFLTFSYIGYGIPLIILCGGIICCCCLPRTISNLGVREEMIHMNQTRVVSDDSINALPTRKFKLKGNENIEGKDSNSIVYEGGIVGGGTEKERAISGEDAVCCICLARYTDNDLLRELPCTHFFHTECADKWLKINASCPLCKFEISVATINPSSVADSNQQV